MSSVASGTFEVAFTPGVTELDGMVARMDFTKTYGGDLAGTSRGFMISAGDPSAGAAGYVAVEVVEGSVDGRRGGLCFQQLGTMGGGEAGLRYVVVPGSGTGDLTGITGSLELVVEAGTHRYTLSYDL